MLAPAGPPPMIATSVSGFALVINTASRFGISNYHALGAIQQWQGHRVRRAYRCVTGCNRHTSELISLSVRGGRSMEALDRWKSHGASHHAALLIDHEPLKRRQRPGVDDLEDVDPDRRAAMAEEGDREHRVFAVRDAIHGEAALDHHPGRDALVDLQHESGGG